MTKDDILDFLTHKKIQHVIIKPGRDRYGVILARMLGQRNQVGRFLCELLFMLTCICIHNRYNHTLLHWVHCTLLFWLRCRCQRVTLVNHTECL